MPFGVHARGALIGQRGKSSRPQNDERSILAWSSRKSSLKTYRRKFANTGNQPARNRDPNPDAVGHADRAHLPADAGGSASFSQEPRRGLLCGIAAGTAELGAERAAAAHQ
jgi:hypothetical protein